MSFAVGIKVPTAVPSVFETFRPRLLMSDSSRHAGSAQKRRPGLAQWEPLADISVRGD